MNIKLPLSKDSIELSTKDKYCEENITVTPEFSSDIPHITKNGSYEVRENQEIVVEVDTNEDANYYLGHVFEGIDEESNTAVCKNCGSVKVIDPNSVYKKLPRLLNTPEEYIYEFGTKDFYATKQFFEVDDPDAANGKAFMCDTNAEYMSANPNFIGICSDIKFHFTSTDTPNTVVGVISLDEQKANLGKGYCMYKFEDYQVPNDSDGNLGYVAAFSNTSFQAKGAVWSTLNQLIGHTVDIYVSMKITGKLNWSKPYPAYSIDRIVIVDKDIIPVETKIIEGTAKTIVNDQATKIRDYAFSYDDSLVRVEFPLVTNVGMQAFSYCTSLTSVNFPNVTSLGTSTFRYCSSLTSVNLPKVTSLSMYALEHCSKLTSIDLPNVTSIDRYAFNYCSGLTSVNLPNVTSIDKYALYYCTSLTSIDLPEVNSIGEYAFNYCSSLTSVNLPNVESMSSGIFMNCTNLTYINLPILKSLPMSTFLSCTSLTSIDLPKVSAIAARAFRLCEKLTSVRIGYENDSVCTLDINVFEDTPIARGEGFIYVKDDLVDAYKSDEKWSTYASLIKPISEFVG